MIKLAPIFIVIGAFGYFLKSGYLNAVLDNVVADKAFPILGNLLLMASGAAIIALVLSLTFQTIRKLDRNQ